MPVNINADTVVGGAVVTADASGVLALQAAGNTVLTLNSSRAIGVGASGSFGTAGQFLQSNGSAAAPTWVTAGTQIVRVDRTSNTILGASNQGNLINITSGTFTQTFDAAATLGSGWFCYISNAGTGQITLDPNASETIDGLTSYIMYPGEVRLVQCNGTNFITVVLASFVATFDSTVTFTRPPGYQAFSGFLWGGGGSGGNGTGIGRASGGGGGACVPFYITNSAFGASQTITIGAGGAAQAAGAAGNVGGTSSIGSLAFSYGGGGGGVGGPGGCGGGGGGALSAGAGGSNATNLGGQPVSVVLSTTNGYSNHGFGGGSASDPSTFTAPAGNSAYGGGAGGSISNAAGASVYGGGGGAGCDNGGTFGTRGASYFGGNGGNGNGVAGTVPAGGGAAGFNATSGAGASGRCVITGVV